MSSPAAVTPRPAIAARSAVRVRTRTTPHLEVRSGRPERIRRVVVGVDGSPNSVAALKRAIVQARSRAAELDVVQAIPDDADDAAANAARAALGQLIDRIVPDQAGIRVRPRVERGHPAAVLLVVSAGAELLIIGARKHSARGNMLGGDTVPRCLGYARCHVDVCADHHDEH
jgi:nucleotide-binding universal stress UspA family protein